MEFLVRLTCSSATSLASSKGPALPGKTKPDLLDVFPIPAEDRKDKYEMDS